jgi:spore coat protein U-like protein
VARSTLWGDGTGGSGVVSNSYILAALATTMKNYTIYATIPAHQNIPPRPYSVIVAVLVTY